MARPQKLGLDYFPLDVDIFEDEKIEAIAGEFGIKGELAVIKLLCAVYKKGYFIVWNDLTKATLLKRLPGVSKELLDQIVGRLVAWEFFNEDLFNSAKVLTSENIQANFFEATKRRKSPKPTDFIINADINTQVDTINVDINTQSKVKESKVNKSKVNASSSLYLDNAIYTSSEACSYWLNQVNPAEAPRILESIDFWVKDFKNNEAIVILAIDEMLKNGATSYNYLDKILKSWESKGLDSVEKAQKHIDGYYQSNKKQRGSNRKETLPDWAIEQEKEREEAERKRNENNEQLEARKREILKEYGL